MIIVNVKERMGRQYAARDGDIIMNSTYQPYNKNPRLSKVSNSCVIL